MAQRRLRPLASIASLFAALGVAGGLLAQPFPPGPENQRRAVAGWLVVIEPDEDGRIVRLSRAHDDFSIDYYGAYWHGNHGPIRRVTSARAGQGCGAFPGWEDQPVEPRFAPTPDVAAMGRRLRAHLAADLAECGATPQQAEAVLDGFEPAFAQAAAYEDAARLWTIAVGEAIERYPETSAADGGDAAADDAEPQ